MGLTSRTRRLLGALCVGAAAVAHAEPGVSDGTLLVGQSAVFSGPVAETGSHYRRGIELYFEQANKAGGIHGRKLQLVALDDAYDPKRTVENTRKLIEEHKVFALIGYVATANLIASLPVAEEARVPMFAPLVGTTSFRVKHSHYLFHVRASYRAELARIVQQLGTVGNENVAVVYQDSVFGKSNMQTFQELAQDAKLRVVKSLPMAVNAADAKDIVAQLKQAAPQAVVMVMAGAMSEVLVRDMRAATLAAPLYTISVGFADAKASAARLQGGLRGVVTASIVPSPRLERYAVVKEYRKAVASAGAAAADNYTVLEGYIAAKVFAEGLKRAGRAPTREGFIKAVEGMGRFDAGDFLVEYGPTNHNGSSFVELEMYTAAGDLVR
jgi:ABC-type branched-subunit amino acid transport system substrate-binding protein